MYISVCICLCHYSRWFFRTLYARKTARDTQQRLGDSHRSAHRIQLIVVRRWTRQRTRSSGRAHNIYLKSTALLKMAVNLPVCVGKLPGARVTVAPLASRVCRDNTLRSVSREHSSRQSVEKHIYVEAAARAVWSGNAAKGAGVLEVIHLLRARHFTWPQYTGKNQRHTHTPQPGILCVSRRRRRFII